MNGKVETERGRINVLGAWVESEHQTGLASATFCDGRARKSVRYSGLSGVR